MEWEEFTGFVIDQVGMYVFSVRQEALLASRPYLPRPHEGQERFAVRSFLATQKCVVPLWCSYHLVFSRPCNVG